MAECRELLSGGIMSYPCELDESHKTNGPVDDREPHFSPESTSSVKLHGDWEIREAARQASPSETIDQVTEEQQRSGSRYLLEQIEPEHDLRDSACLMRPLDAAVMEGHLCPVCNPRPQVLVENAEDIEAGLIHNPYDPACRRGDMGGSSRAKERCWICRPDTLASGSDSPSIPQQRSPGDFDTSGELQFCPEHSCPLIYDFMGKTPYCPECGWSPGDEQVAPQPQPEPSKQREGDQRLPNKGHMVVQDWIIETMRESKRVGTERYGQPLHTFDGRLNIKDLAEELRDAFVYVSKMQMMAEADKATLVEMVTQALDLHQHTQGPEEMTTVRIAEVAVDKILDWVLIQRIGPDQVAPISPVNE